MTEISVPILEADAAPVKLALCVYAADLPDAWAQSRVLRLIPITEDFWDIRTHLVDRRVCETDPTTQQLLPYNMLVNEKGEIFTYSRGKGGAEARLHAKWSIGVGGHVDGVPPPETTLMGWLILEALREIEEEIKLRLLLNPVYTHLIADRDDDVGSVHLGLLSINKVSSAEILTLEANVLEHGQWIDYRKPESAEMYLRLENWSRAAVDAVMAGTISL